MIAAAKEPPTATASIAARRRSRPERESMGPEGLPLGSRAAGAAPADGEGHGNPLVLPARRHRLDGDAADDALRVVEGHLDVEAQLDGLDARADLRAGVGLRLVPVAVERLG